MEEEVETTPVFSPGEKFHGQRSLGAVTTHGVAESNLTQPLTLSLGKICSPNPAQTSLPESV